jgi:hypothetical protein
MVKAGRILAKHVVGQGNHRPLEVIGQDQEFFAIN